MNLTAVILAAGHGTRARSDIPKQLVKVAGRALVAHSVAAFVPHVERVIVIHTPGLRDEFAAALTGFDTVLVEGGATRNASTVAALGHVETSHVLIHDAVRPLVSAQVIERVTGALSAGALAVDTVIRSTDTLVTNTGPLVNGFPDRDHIWRGQTPQGFEVETLRRAYESGLSEFSDDCQVVHAAGFDVTVVDGDEANIKVTHPGDFAICDRLFQARTTVAPHPHGNVVVVGGTSGIGAAVAARTGATILGRSTGFDVTNPDPAALEGADVVIVTAGILHAGPLESMPDHEITDMVATNLTGTIRTAQAAAKHLHESGRGHLVLCSSSSYTRGRANLAVYSATKAAIVALTQALADEWPNLRVNCICPERTDTPMRRNAFGPEPAHTLMDVDDAANQIVDILSTDLTGQIFDVRSSRT